MKTEEYIKRLRETKTAAALEGGEQKIAREHEKGKLRENGYIESFHGKLRDELLNREVFTTLTEAKILIEQWRIVYNDARPYSSLGYQPPAPEARMLITLT